MANTDNIDKEVLQWDGGPTTDWDTTEKSLLGHSAEVEAGSAAVVIAGVVIGVLFTIFLLFSFALIIDCKNKKKQGALQDETHVKRKAFLKKTVFTQFMKNSNKNRENISFANKMFGDSQTIPPSCNEV